MHPRKTDGFTCHGCHSGNIVSTCKAMLEKRRLYEKGFVTEDGKTQLPGLLHVYCRISSNSFAWFLSDFRCSMIVIDVIPSGNLLHSY